MEGVMKRKNFTSEQIVALLREPEVVKV